MLQATGTPGVLVHARPHRGARIGGCRGRRHRRTRSGRSDRSATSSAGRPTSTSPRRSASKAVLPAARGRVGQRRCWTSASRTSSCTWRSASRSSPGRTSTPRIRAEDVTLETDPVGKGERAQSPRGADRRDRVRGADRSDRARLRISARRARSPRRSREELQLTVGHAGHRGHQGDLGPPGAEGIARRTIKNPNLNQIRGTECLL